MFTPEIPLVRRTEPCRSWAVKSSTVVGIQKHPRALAASFVLAVALATHVASAAGVTYAYQGTVTKASGIFADQGSVVAGSFSFDTALQPSAAYGPPTYAFYQGNFPAANQALIPHFHATVIMGTVELSAAAVYDPKSQPFLLIRNNEKTSVVVDSVYYVFPPPKLPGTLTDFELIANDKDPSPDGVRDGLLDGSMNGVRAVLSSLDLAKFSFEGAGPYGYWVQYDAQGKQIGRVDFAWTSVEPVPSELEHKRDGGKRRSRGH